MHNTNKNEGLWLQELKKACEASSQAAVAERLRRSQSGGTYPSPAVISTALKGTYAGDLGRLQGLVEGVLCQATVDCPVIGEMPRQRCLDHQTRREFAATNPTRVQLHRTCPTCEHRR